MDTIAEYGAGVVKAGRYCDEREAKARSIAEATGVAFVHPFNDPDVIAGQGTCGLELANQLDGIDAVLVPVGGGGLISGISTALKAMRPGTKVYGVEPQGAPKLTEALRAKKVVTVPSPPRLLTDLSLLRWADSHTNHASGTLMGPSPSLRRTSSARPRP